MYEHLGDHSHAGPELATPAVGEHVAETAFPPPPSPASRRPDRSGAQPVTDRTLRRLYGWETLVVLSIFPLGTQQLQQSRTFSCTSQLAWSSRMAT